MDTVEQVDEVEALGGRIFEAALGAADILSIYLGDRLGWYRSLAADGRCTATELAGRTGTHERYAREWLEQQAVTGLLSVEDAGDPADRRYSIPAAAAEVFTDETSLSYLAPFARMFASAAIQLPSLLDAYRTGGGVGWKQFGADARESQADMNRPWYERQLPGALAATPSVHEALSRPGARIADVGCGGGWSSIALARAYPDATIDGIDVDAGSVDMARKNAASAGVADRVTFTHADAAGLTDATYDAVFAFECVHDMPRPVDVLAAVERALTPDGFVVVMDEAVAEKFSAPGDDLERIMYGFSLLVCLPDGMSSPPSAGTGTVMRPDTLRRYAQEAGLTSFEILPIEGFGFWRFYRLAR
jgi:2-polyprenyl-3-methyl-5-hydroxy-6-metoxy-1,4-benzoquinol methylase